MANKILTPDVIAKEALMQLENNLVFGNLVHRDYKKEFKKVGNSVAIRKPVKFQAKDGATLQKQDVTEGETNITLDQRKHVGWEFDTQTLTLSIEEYSERYIKPAVIELAHQVDQSVAGLYSQLWNNVGTPGTPPSTFAHLGAVAQRMDNGAVPDDGMRHGVWNPNAGWSLADGLKGVYVQEKAKTALERGALGMYASMDHYRSQHILNHTVGAHGGTPLVNGADQNVTYASVADAGEQTLVTDGWTASAAVLNAGDVFTIADVYAVNPRTRQSTGELQQFVVKSAVSADGTGNATVTISPAIITDGAYQTVNAVPADNAAITVMGTAGSQYAQNLCFHKNAFGLVTCPLEMPDGANWKAQESANGYNIRVIKDYDIVNDVEIIRLDMLWGVKAIYPELAVRRTG
jgi:hypothetical protein